MSQENPKLLQKQTIGLQCYITIPQHVTIIHDNRIDLNENKYVFKDLNEVPPSDDWFQYEYIDAEVNNKLDKNKGQLVGDEMEKETKNYVESLNHNLNRLKMITIEIDKSWSIVTALNSSCICICNGEKTTVLLHPPEH